MQFLHLLFNGSALWSLGMVEALGPAAGYGTAYYLQTSLILLIFSGAVRARPPARRCQGIGLKIPRSNLRSQMRDQHVRAEHAAAADGIQKLYLHSLYPIPYIPYTRYPTYPIPCTPSTTADYT